MAFLFPEIFELIICKFQIPRSHNDHVIGCLMKKKPRVENFETLSL
jgi:hypothetical protein